MFWAMGILLLVQAIDNYVLMPRIVGSRVNLNALVSITGVLTGGAIAGIGGMFLSIPFLAITKTIFDRVEPLQPYGKVMGGNIEKKEKKKRAVKKT